MAAVGGLPGDPPNRGLHSLSPAADRPRGPDRRSGGPDRRSGGPDRRSGGPDRRSAGPWPQVRGLRSIIGPPDDHRFAPSLRACLKTS
ncbi:MAG: hypothetical protein EXS06_08325 [Planctomycetaceae bacterium]|nr:hypothetical protein [Planctomycetaceae bacterium]